MKCGKLDELVCDGENGGPVAERWRLNNEEGRDIAAGCATTESEPDRGALIWSVAGAPSCKHEWIADDEGGLEATGGAWGLSERLMEIRQHCRWCGLHRVQRTTAAEKAPVKHYTVVYTQPES